MNENLSSQVRNRETLSTSDNAISMEFVKALVEAQTGKVVKAIIPKQIFGRNADFTLQNKGFFAIDLTVFPLAMDLTDNGCIPPPALLAAADVPWMDGGGSSGTIPVTGALPFTLSVISQPSWMSVNLNGSQVDVSGTPLLGVNDDLHFTLTNACGVAVYDHPVSIDCRLQVSLTDTFPVFNDGENIAYSENLVSSLPVTFTIISKPSWMTVSLDGLTVNFTGVPSVSDMTVLDYTFTDACGNVTRSQKSVSVIIPCVAASFANGVTATLYVGSPVVQDINVLGTPPFVYTPYAGAITPGLTATLVGSVMQIRGTPTTVDNYPRGTWGVITNSCNTSGAALTAPSRILPAVYVCPVPSFAAGTGLVGNNSDFAVVLNAYSGTGSGNVTGFHYVLNDSSGLYSSGNQSGLTKTFTRLPASSYVLSVSTQCSNGTFSAAITYSFVITANFNGLCGITGEDSAGLVWYKTSDMTSGGSIVPGTYFNAYTNNSGDLSHQVVNAPKGSYFVQFSSTNHSLTVYLRIGSRLINVSTHSGALYDFGLQVIDGDMTVSTS